MPIYKITDPTTGKRLKLKGDSPPTEQELEEIFSQSRTAPEPRSGVNVPLETVKGTVGTIAKSGGRLLGNVASSVIHPGRTVKSIVGLGVGTVQKAIPGRQAQERYPEAFGGYLKKRYGGVERIAETVAEDPVGFVADVYGAGAGVGGILKGAGKLTGLKSLQKAGSFPTTTRLLKTGAEKVTKPISSKLSRFKADYIPQNVAPRAFQMFQENVRKFTPGIQEFAKNKLKVSINAINSIKKKTVAGVEAVRKRYNDSTDTIFQKITTGISNKRKIADTAYKSSVKNFKGNQINSSEFYGSVQSSLRKKGWVDLRGNPTTRYKSGLDPIADGLTDIYLDMRPTTTATGGVVKGQVLSKQDFMTYRDKMSQLLRDKPSDTLVMNARNSLYNSAEKSGMSGIKMARDLERKAFQFERRFVNKQGQLKALGKETSLDRFQKLSKDQVRQLKEIEDYTGIKFVDDLDSITAARELDKLRNLDINKFKTDLINAINPRETKFIKGQYESILGKGSSKIFKDITSHRRAIGAKTLTRRGLLTYGAYKLGEPIFKRGE